MARNSILQERNHALQLCKNNLIQSKYKEVGAISNYVSLHEATANYCDDRRSYLGSHRSICMLMFIEVYNANLNALSVVNNKEEINVFTSSSNIYHSTSDKEERVFFLNELCKIRFELLYFIDYDELPRFANDFIESLQDLIEIVDMTKRSNRQYILHKKGMFYASLARFSQKNGDWGSSINYGLSSVDELGILLSQVTTSDIDFPILILDYIDGVWTLSMAYKMVGEVEEALKWANIALMNAKEFYSRYNGEERLMLMHLCKLYATVAVLQGEEKDYDAAKRTLVDMNMTLSTYSPEIVNDMKLFRIDEAMLQHLGKRV